MGTLADRINRFAKLAQHFAPPETPGASGPRGSTQHSVDERPGCTYGAVTRQRTQDLADQLARMETKLNAMLGGIALAIAVDIIRGLRP